MAGSIVSSDNLSAAPKDAFSTEISTVALAVPPIHPDDHSLDSVMRQSLVEKASKEKNVHENASHKCQIMTSAEVSSRNKRKRKRKRKRKKRRVEGHDAIESNHNLSPVPKDAFSTETSTAALAMPPTHPDGHTLDSVMRQSQVEKALNEETVLVENGSDESKVMASLEVSSKKRKRNRKPRWMKARRNYNIECGLDMPSQHPALDEKNQGEDLNMVEKATDGSPEVKPRKKKNRGRKRRRKTRYDSLQSNVNIECGLDMPSQHPALDEENQRKDPSMVEKATDGSPAMARAQLKPRKKTNRGKRRRKKKTRHGSLQSNANFSGVSKDCPEETNDKDNLIQEGGNNVEDKIGEHFKSSNLDCTQFANNGMPPSDDGNELVNLSDVEALQDSHASLLTFSGMVDKDATVGEIQNSSEPVEQVFGPVDVIPSDQSNIELVMEPLEQVQQLPFADSLAAPSSLSTSPRMVDEDATVGEIQNSSRPVEEVFGLVDAISADQSNPELVMEPLEQVQQLPSTEPLASHQDTAVEMQISAQQVEAVSIPVDALPAGQFNHDIVMEPLEPLPQLPSAEPLASNPDTSAGLLNSSQQVEPIFHEVDVAQANGLNHESLVQEFLQQMQQLPPAESPNSTHDPSMATEIELRSNNEDSLSGHSPPAEPPKTTHHPSMATEIELGSNNGDYLSLHSPPAEPPNSTHVPSMSAEIELLLNNEDSLPDHAPPAPMEVTNQAVVHPSSNSELDSHTPVGAYRTQSLDTRNVFTLSNINNHLRQTAIPSMKLIDDPLKNELERLCKESEQNMKYYEDMKLQLKSDCEREIEETRRKYDNKLRESEFESQLKKKNLDSSLNLVMMNKMWAEAFRCECMDLVSGAPGVLQDPSSGQQLALFSKLLSPASVLPYFAAAACSQAMVPPIVSSMQILGPPIPARALPLPAAYGAPPRPPHINSIFSPLPNHQAVGLPRPNFLARESAMDGTCQLGRNLPNTSRARDDSVRPAMSPDIVCLSDDD